MTARVPLYALPGDKMRGEAVKNMAVALGGLAVPELGAAREIAAAGAPFWLTALGFIAAVYFLRRRN